MRWHLLSPADLAALAAGHGGAPVVRELRTSQLSRHLLLLKYISERWPIEREGLDSAVAVLATAQQRDPLLYAELLGDPLVGAWLATTTRRLRAAESSAVPLSGDLLHLGAIAAAAAVRLQLDCELPAYARNGRLTLPTVGAAAVPDGPTRIQVTGGRSVLLERGWQPLRRLTASHDGLTATVTVEDGNPYRNGYHAPPSERLSDEEIRHWQGLFTGAWELLGRFHPGRAAELTAGLRALVPLVDDGSGAARSGTARDSIGALGLTRPRSAVDFAITIVHEARHSTLSAVLDLVDLYEPDGAELHFAPWRTDPRPTAGLIQGVYAFLGVADTWRGLRAAPGLEATATEQLAIVREQVRAGLAALESSRELTDLGRHFTHGLHEATERLFADPLPAAAVRKANSALAASRSAWVS